VVAIFYNTDFLEGRYSNIIMGAMKLNQGTEKVKVDVYSKQAKMTNYAGN